VIDTKIKPFVADKIKASLGDPDEDLVDFVLENIRDRKGPEDIIDGLEPVRIGRPLSVVTDIPGIG
jgi:RNA-binding protein 25